MELSLREKISEILVKWSMPTRQVAINEILSAVSEEAEGMKKETRTCSVPNCTMCHDIKAEGYNSALSDLKERINL